MFVPTVLTLFTDTFYILHYDEIEHECEAISSKNDKIARNCLVSTLNCISWNEIDERFKILTPYSFKRELSLHFINFY